MGFLGLFSRCKNTNDSYGDEDEEYNLSWVEISKNPPDSSFYDIVIKNEKGWKRICTCMHDFHGDGGFSCKFYDHNDIEIRGFKATHYITLPK